ncbi:hypothetical protein DOT_4523 [Desulfosporosinus sp. OT]|nr:hypothetical protein DOT_4523 [Desulfosporosinus sp. OT]
MLRALGANTESYFYWFGSFYWVSGLVWCLIAQSQSYVDIGMGIGI